MWHHELTWDVDPEYCTGFARQLRHKYVAEFFYDFLNI